MMHENFMVQWLDKLLSVFGCIGTHVTFFACDEQPTLSGEGVEPGSACTDGRWYGGR